LRIARRGLGQRIPGGRHDQDRPSQRALERESEILQARSTQQLPHLRRREGGVAGFANGGAMVSLLENAADGAPCLTKSFQYPHINIRLVHRYRV
jgi:hypothetical protein